MSRTCLVCWSPERTTIDQALLEHARGYRHIAARFHISSGSLRRHERHHLAHALSHTKEARIMMDSEALVAKLLELDAAVRRVLARGEASGDDRLVLMAVREGRGDVETLARLGALNDIEERIAALETAQKVDGAS